MFKINYTALLKALSSLFLPTLSVCIFTFFLVLDINKLINIIFGPNYYSIIIRFIILILEIFLFYKMYKYYESKEIIKKVIENIDNPESFSKKLKSIFNRQIKMDRYNDIIIDGFGENNKTFTSRFIGEKEQWNNVSIYEIDMMKNIDTEIDIESGVNIENTISNIKYFLVKSEIIK